MVKLMGVSTGLNESETHGNNDVAGYMYSRLLMHVTWVRVSMSI